jgi:(2Fe-2S) ferredoxin
MGAGKVVSQIENKLGIQCGETTSDGKFTLVEAECLGACGYAPMMMIGPYFYEFLDRGKVDAIVDALSRDERPPVPPAGYFQKDQAEPAPGRDAALPTASEEIRDHLAVHGNRNGAGKGEA